MVEIGREDEQEPIVGALLALAIVPTSIVARQTARMAKLSARTASELVAMTPLKQWMIDLDHRWERERVDAAGAAQRFFNGTMDAVLDRLDPTQIVIDRIDINRIVAERVNLNAIVARIDVVALAREVVRELDVPEIIRDSSSTMATETVEGIRTRGMEADRSISGFIDRLLQRRSGRDVGSGDADPLPRGAT
jgi:hypothetical protein